MVGRKVICVKWLMTRKVRCISIIRNIAKHCALLAVVLSFIASPLLAFESNALKNGIPVIVEQTKSKMVSIRIVVKGGASYLDEDTSGMEMATFNWMTYGTNKYSKEALDLLSYDKGFAVSSAASQDSAALFVTCIDKYMKTALDVLCDMFVHPAFTDESFTLVTDDIKASLAYKKEDPESMLGQAVSDAVYAHHPYRVKSFVTERSFPSITRENMREMHTRDMDSRRIFVVASGNVSSSSLASKLNSTIGKIPALDTPLLERKIPALDAGGDDKVITSKALDKSGYMQWVIPGPTITDDDVLDATIASDMYTRQLFNVVRESHGICYGAQSILSSGKIGFAGVYLSNVKDFSNAVSAVNEARTLLSDGRLVSSKDEDGFVYESISDAIEGVKNAFLNTYYEKAASVSSICARLSYSILVFGDPASYDELIKGISNVTAKGALDAFNKYWTQDGQWFAVLGPHDSDKIKF